MTAACLMSTYQPLALSFTRGLGTRLWDQQGREYLDAVAGVAVTNVGHSHPKLVTAISEQAGSAAAHLQPLQHRLAATAGPAPDPTVRAWTARSSTTPGPKPTRPR